MKRILIISTALMLLFVIACRTTSIGYIPKENIPQTVKNWNKTIDEVSFLEHCDITNYTQIEIHPIDVSQVKYPDESDNTYEPVVRLVNTIDDVFLASLKKYTSLPVQINGTKENDVQLSDNRLILKCKANSIHPGSKGLRFWIGFGAGSSRSEIEGELIDNISGKVFMRFTHARISPMDIGDYYQMMTEEITEIGEDVSVLLNAYGNKEENASAAD